jgi:hypothetical protein
MKEYLFKKAADIVLAKLAERLQGPKPKVKVTASMDDLEAALNHHLRDIKNWSAEVSFADSRGSKTLDRIFISLDVFLQPSEVFDLKPTSGNPGIRIEFVGWRPSRNCSTAMSLSKWSVLTVCT